MRSIKDEDREGVQSVWNNLVNKKTAVTHEFRFKTPWQDPNGNQGDTWVLMSAYPERDQDGVLKSVFGSITNISQQKVSWPDVHFPIFFLLPKITCSQDAWDRASCNVPWINCADYSVV